MLSHALVMGMALLSAPCAGALAAPPSPPPSGAEGGGEGGIAFGDLPAASRLGLRAEQMRRQSLVLPEVVIVPDGLSYLRAIEAWTPQVRFPVLIDDGTSESREDIARFVRAFEPQRVVRWEHDRALDETRPTQRNLRELATAAVAGAWDLEFEPGATADELTSALVEQWRDDAAAMPGIVVAGAGDDAWPAAVALSALRAQPIVWATMGRNVSGTTGAAPLDALDALLRARCEELGLDFEALGDRIDAVTLCLHLSVKFKREDGEVRATTDRIGRLTSDGPRRWAWSSQIFGSEARSAYQAMSAFFLSPRRAWLFDTYPSGDPWSTYSLVPAGTALQQAGVEVELFHTPGNRRSDWVREVGRAVDADLVMVNTKGLRSFFEFSDERAYGGDVPVLGRPAIVHFIHSWSAVQPAVEHTVAAKWLARGAIAYAGAVDEPYLQAFLPPEAVVNRLRMAFPWGAAPRHDESPVWKIALFGDALLTAGPASPRTESPLPLEGAEDLAAALTEAAGAKDYARTLELLALLGRDDDAARLAQALLAQSPEAVEPDVAEAAYFSVARAGPPQLLVELFERMGPEARAEGARADALWARARLLLNAAGRPEAEPAIATLAANLRAEQFGSDAADVAAAIGRAEGAVGAVAFLSRLQAPNDREKVQVERALQKWRQAAGLR